jgi:hypothetical protein
MISQPADEIGGSEEEDSMSTQSCDSVGPSSNSGVSRGGSFANKVCKLS